MFLLAARPGANMHKLAVREAATPIAVEEFANCLTICGSWALRSGRSAGTGRRGWWLVHGFQPNSLQVGDFCPPAKPKLCLQLTVFPVIKENRNSLISLKKLVNPRVIRQVVQRSFVVQLAVGLQASNDGKVGY